MPTCIAQKAARARTCMHAHTRARSPTPRAFGNDPIEVASSFKASLLRYIVMAYIVMAHIVMGLW